MRYSIVSSERPILECKIGTSDTELLLDTGAFYSVYLFSEQVLFAKYKGVIKTEDKVLIGGFGKGKSLCSIYIIPEIVIGGLTLYRVPVALCKNNLQGVELILASNIFKKTPFRIDYQNQIIEFDSKTNQIWCNYKTKDSIWVSTYVFTQNPNS